MPIEKHELNLIYGMSYIRSMNNLRSVDLNLLVVLHALLEERHITRAAERLNLSQPAVSHALSRLRKMFDDILLVRAGRVMVPTAKALGLKHDLLEVIAGTKRLLGQTDFDPALSQSTVRLAMSDYGSKVILPGLLKKLRTEAPGMTAHVRQLDRMGMGRGVEDGVIDLAFGVFPSVTPSLDRRTLFTEKFVCVLDARNPASRHLSLEAYLQSAHILVSMNGEPEGEIEAALAAIGVSRNIAMVVPHFTIAASLIPGTDAVLTVASKAVPAESERAGLVVVEAPFEIETFAFAMVSRKHGLSAPAAWIAQACLGVEVNEALVSRG